jgi:hypothetical protein
LLLLRRNRLQPALSHQPGPHFLGFLHCFPHAFLYDPAVGPTPAPTPLRGPASKQPHAHELVPGRAAHRMQASPTQSFSPHCLHREFLQKGRERGMEAASRTPPLLSASLVQRTHKRIL